MSRTKHHRDGLTWRRYRIRDWDVVGHRDRRTDLRDENRGDAYLEFWDVYDVRTGELDYATAPLPWSDARDGRKRRTSADDRRVRAEAWAKASVMWRPGDVGGLLKYRFAVQSRMDRGVWSRIVLQGVVGGTTKHDCDRRR